jgi:hypothetical protein
MLSDRFGAFEGIANLSSKHVIPLLGRARPLFAPVTQSAVCGC